MPVYSKACPECSVSLLTNVLKRITVTQGCLPFPGRAYLGHTSISKAFLSIFVIIIQLFKSKVKIQK
jgi:hypothetical protein